MTTHLPGLVLTEHTLTVPLDHADPGGPTIEVFAREVVAPDQVDDDLPWLLFLQGGPGGASPRPTRATGWIGHAVKTHRLLLLDQRGCGRSTPVTARCTEGRSDQEIAAYLRHFRADSIVRDAELLRHAVAGGKQWETLGQSYGGWITLAYLSHAPEALRACYVTGGLPGLTATADEVYERTYAHMAEKNERFSGRYPDDRELLRRIADHLDTHDVRLPDGDRFTTRRLRLLGGVFGKGEGFEQVHWVLEQAWDGAELSDVFRREVMARTAHAAGPLYALQEHSCYGHPGSAPGWAAQRALEQRPEWAEDADPLLFTGEMMYPWMFEDIAALRPFRGAAQILMASSDWPPLWDFERLAANEVPVAAAVYFDDAYVDAGLSLQTARAVPHVRTWVTNEWEHDGLQDEVVLARLMDMVAGKV